MSKIDKVTTRTFISVWKKNDLRCKITSTYNGKDRPVFKFAGYNPFPCYSMVASYNAVYSWMENNGWENVGKVTSIYHTDEIDNSTGEVLSTYISRMETLVVPKPRPENIVECCDELTLADDDDEIILVDDGDDWM